MPRLPKTPTTSAANICAELIRKQRDVETLRNALLDGFNSGPAAAMEPDFFDRMRKRALSRRRA